jgi:anti-sigma-K factor RskA
VSSHDKYTELAALCALGVLVGEDLIDFEQHLAAGCDACAATIAETHSVAGSLVYALDPVAPSSATRVALFERVRRDEVERARTNVRPIGSRSVRWLAPMLAAAAVLLAVGLGLQVSSLSDLVRLEQARFAALETQTKQRDLTEQARFAKLSAEAEQLRGQASRLSAEFAGVEDVVATITAPRSVPVSLAGQGPAPGAKARAFVDPDNRRLVLYVYDLPEPPPDRTYQAWCIIGGTPWSAGVFEVDDAGRTRFRAEQVPDWEGGITVAVTEEPAGGVPAPTGPMVLAGSYGN